MAFDAQEAALTVIEQLAPIEAKLKQRRKSLADEVIRAAESIALNVSEARQRAGLDRPDLYRRAAGSAAELTTALRIARARGFITAADYATVDVPLDRVRAMLWRLTTDRGEGHRPDPYRRVAGSAAELTTALRIARARLITLADYADVDVPLDRVRVMLWRLTH